MRRIYIDRDTDLSALRGKTVAIIGYGNQGEAQAKNIRDSGVEFIIGSIAEAVHTGHVISLLVPDEVQKEVFEGEIQDGLSPGKALNFAHGYNLRFGFIDPPPDVDVFMVAPRMIGVNVRKAFKRGSGVPAYLAVWQDSSGQAKAMALALAKAIGATRVGVIETTIAEETELDLFAEQAVWPIIMRDVQVAFEVLVEEGFSPEMVALELYGSGEAAEIFAQMAHIGFFKQARLHSQTSQYGTLSRAERMLPEDVRAKMRSVLADIRNGTFAAEWKKEQEEGYPSFSALKKRASEHPLNDAEARVRALVDSSVLD